MFRRRALLGVLATVVLSGAAAAKPPESSGPLPEGRELDPVVRDYFLPTPPGERIRDRAPARPAEKPGDTIDDFLTGLLRGVGRLGGAR